MANTWRLPDKYKTLVSNCSPEGDYVLLDNPSREYFEKRLGREKITTYCISRNTGLLWQVPQIFAHPVILFRRKIKWLPTKDQPVSNPLNYCFMVVTGHPSMETLIANCKYYGTLIIGARVI